VADDGIHRDMVIGHMVDDVDGQGLDRNLGALQFPRHAVAPAAEAGCSKGGMRYCEVQKGARQQNAGPDRGLSGIWREGSSVSINHGILRSGEIA
jgi:hypothetical protein